MAQYEFVGSKETFCVEVPDEWDLKLAEFAKARGITKAALILEILKNYLDEQEKLYSSGDK